MNVLLVTGSRSLSNNETAYDAWLELFPSLAKHAARIVAGDAVGPDRWAIRHAANNGTGFEEWNLDGCIYSSRSGPSHWWSASKPRPSSNRWPLERNKAMVSRCNALRDLEALRPLYYDGPGYETRVLCVGFVDPQSRTHGTDHTLRLARQAGIWTARYVWQGESFEEQSNG